jgi:hypothetical protein
MTRVSVSLAALVALIASTGCVRVKRPDVQPAAAPPGATLWVDPGNLQTRDLLYGPWGVERAPRPDATYTFVERKHSGVNPGMTVVDPQGREWSVKQMPPGALDLEAQVEVTVSRLLSAIGYHQAPVYFLPKFTLKDDWGTHTEVGGRFRLKDKMLKDAGTWAWHQNPFIGSRPYQGLLVLMMMFNSTDLKDSNNSIYEYRIGDRVEQWFAVRDIGSALGDTRRLGPYKNDPDAFEQEPFIIGVTSSNYVQFAYTGYYERYVRNRLSPADVVWASRLLGELTDKQWRDAFQAGGYDPQTAGRFIRVLREKIRDGQALSRRLRS